MTSSAIETSLADLDAEAVARWGLKEFVKIAWPLVEPSASLQWSWHLDAICDHLQAVTRREIRDLVINVPPGCSKSLVASVLWPAWVWTSDPGHRWMWGSYSEKVTLRDAEKMRSLVKSTWYRERWPGVEIPSGKAQSDAVSVFRTTKGGMRYSEPIHGQWTGEHADTLGIDDPIDARRADATSGVQIDGVLSWWNGTIQTRFRDHKRSARMLIMQRLHERDLSAEMIRSGATVLCLPMRYEPKHPHRWAGDPRQAGELLVPERIPEAEVKRIETTMGPTRTAGQHQQRPTAEGGSVFKEPFFAKRWVTLPENGAGGIWTQSWDMAFKSTKDSSYVVGGVWLQLGANHFVIDQVRGRWGFSDTCAQVKDLSAQYPRTIRKLIEAKANGPAVADQLMREVSGIELIEPEGGKESRANATEPLWAAGNVILPDERLAVYEAPWCKVPAGVRRIGAPWLADYIAEHLSFPNGANDDQVDQTSQYLNFAGQNRYASTLARAMNNVFRR